MPIILWSKARFYGIIFDMSQEVVTSKKINRELDESLARVLAVEQDIIESGIDTRQIRAKSKTWLGRLMSRGAIKRTEMEIHTAQSELFEVIEANRREGEILAGFFGVKKGLIDPSAVWAEVARVAALADPTQYPEGVYLEAEELRKKIVTLEPGKNNANEVTLFDSLSIDPQVKGLSLAVALHHAGFASEQALEQFRENLDTELAPGKIDTYAVLHGPSHILWAGMITNENDVKVSCIAFPPIPPKELHAA